MTAPGVGVGGGIWPPGIPSRAVVPRGFSSLSHESDAEPRRQGERGCSWIHREGGFDFASAW